jgi:site-specific recombinase XerD
MKFRQHMVLRGFAENTKDAYVHAMSELVLAYGGVSPDLLTCEQIQAHVAHLIKERHLAWSTVNVHVSAFSCFYREMLKRRGDAFSLPPRGRSEKAPTVLDRESVRLILAAHTNIKHRALLAMVYGSGLRVSEVCRLRPCHIESAADRMLVRVEQSKGRKDRYTLLAHSALTVLRAYWLECRPREWLFPGVLGLGPLSARAAQRVYKQACAKTGIAPDRAHGIHTLRHCFASHLMEDGVALPVIQRLLGHGSLKTTAVYCHVSRAMLQDVRSPGDTLCGWARSGGKG